MALWTLMINYDDAVQSQFNYCPTYFNYVRVNQKGICCSACQYWYQTSCCNVSNSLYIRTGSRYEDWFCMLCLSSILPFINVIMIHLRPMYVVLSIIVISSEIELIICSLNCDFWIMFVILCIFLIIRRIMLFLIECIIIKNVIKLMINLLKLVLVLNYLVCSLIVAVLRHILIPFNF